MCHVYFTTCIQNIIPNNHSTKRRYPQKHQSVGTDLDTFTMSASLAAADLFSCDGLVAVITGGGSGIGMMIAKAL